MEYKATLMLLQFGFICIASLFSTLSYCCVSLALPFPCVCVSNVPIVIFVCVCRAQIKGSAKSVNAT